VFTHAYIVLFFSFLCANFNSLNKIRVKFDIGAFLIKTGPLAWLFKC